MNIDFELHLFLKTSLFSELVYKTWHLNTLNHTPLQSAGDVKTHEGPHLFNKQCSPPRRHFLFFFFYFSSFFFFTRNLTNTLLFLGKTHKITLALSYTVANVTFLLQVCNLTLNRLNMVTIITELGYKIWIKETVLASQMITNQLFSTSPDHHTIKIGSGWFRLTFHSWEKHL